MVLKKMHTWILIIAMLILTSTMSREVLRANKQTYYAIHQTSGKISKCEKIRLIIEKRLPTVKPLIFVKTVKIEICNRITWKFWESRNQKQKIEILLRQQRARSTIDKIEHMFYYIPSEHVQKKEFGLWKITKERLWK